MFFYSICQVFFSTFYHDMRLVICVCVCVCVSLLHVPDIFLPAYYNYVPGIFLCVIIFQVPGICLWVLLLHKVVFTSHSVLGPPIPPPTSSVLSQQRQTLPGHEVHTPGAGLGTSLPQSAQSRCTYLILDQPGHLDMISSSS